MSLENQKLGKVFFLMSSAPSCYFPPTVWPFILPQGPYKRALDLDPGERDRKEITTGPGAGFFPFRL